MNRDLDIDKIAKGVGGKRVGKVESSSGYFGAMQLAAEVTRRFKVPHGGGRRTDRRCTEKRLVAFTPETLERLDHISAILNISRFQAAGLILEKAVEEIREEDLEKLPIRNA